MTRTSAIKVDCWISGTRCIGAGVDFVIREANAPGGVGAKSRLNAV